MNDKRIITYALHTDSIDYLADYICKRFVTARRDLSRLAVVFSGKRPALFLRKALFNRIQKSFTPPQFFTINSFVDYIVSLHSPVSSLSEMNACYYIYTIAQRVAKDIIKDRQQFSLFLPWAREIMHLIDQLDMDDVGDEHMRDIQENALIGYDIPENINVMLQHIITIRKEYHGVLKHKKAFSKGLKYLTAAHAISSIHLSEYDEILFCNFFYLPKTQQQIINYLIKEKKATYLVQGNADEWAIIKKQESVFTETDYADHCFEKKTDEPRITLHSCFDMHSQVSTVGDIIKHIDDIEKTVVVLPNVDMVVPLVSELSSFTDDFNVSMGYPIKRSSLYSLFEMIFALQSSRNDEAYYSPDYLSAIRHPLVKNLVIAEKAAVSRVLIHKIEELLLGIEESSIGGNLFVKNNDIERCEALYAITQKTLENMGFDTLSNATLEKTVASINTLVCGLWEGVQTFKDLSRCVEEFLDVLLNKSTLKNYPLNLSVVKQLYNYIDELRNADYACEQFDTEELFKVFLHFLQNMKISFSGSPLKGLQVLGRLETRSLNFKNVIICDMNEGSMPRLKRYLPLIPREVMAQLNIDMFEAEEEIQRYHFMRLVRSSEKVHLIYNASSERERSRFIEALVWKEEQKNKCLGSYAEKKGYYETSTKEQEMIVKKTDDVLRYLTSQFNFSASSVNTYVACPMRFYYQYVLRLKEREDFLEEPEGADIGDFIHKLLEKAYSGFLGTAPNITVSFQKKILSMLQDEFKTSFEKKMKSDSFAVLQIMQHKMKKFMEYEMKRCTEPGSQRVRSIVGLEKNFTDKIKCGKHSVTFTAYVDRIDELYDGSYLVLDYKTGSKTTLPAAITQLEKVAHSDRQSIKRYIRSFQMPLYLHFTKQENPNIVCDAALYNIRTCTLNFFSKKVKEEFPFHRSLSICMESLENIIVEILDPEAPFVVDRENANQCSLCPFKSLCA